MSSPTYQMDLQKGGSATIQTQVPGFARWTLTVHPVGAAVNQLYANGPERDYVIIWHETGGVLCGGRGDPGSSMPMRPSMIVGAGRVQAEWLVQRVRAPQEVADAMVEALCRFFIVPYVREDES